ncbi:DUF1802 family protein [Pantanalinema sp. GBBB05]|uniref:DUF1802 family protein n=1 Tax=Pantanalinema sp. GBBB05 TaxID=2604139 RepID=UPI001D247F73|nr:DUF1802 family protein [Pantanalinema sp. GBBB05]
MTNSASISTALCLAASDVEALIQGRMIAALSRTFVNSVQSFALCPIDSAKVNDTIEIQAWAKLEFCKIYSDSTELEKLSKITIWANDSLQQVLKERYKVFLICLRVYQLPTSIELPVNRLDSNKIGSFIKLPSYLTTNNSKSVLSDVVFQKRQQQLASLELPLHPDLEELYRLIVQSPTNDPATKLLEHDLSVFLGWANELPKMQFDPDLSWIRKISDVGNSSDGHEFEKLVRKGLLKLGFRNTLNDPKASLNPEATGGSAGLDAYCNLPYPLVAECKASKYENVPNSVSAQLIHLGNTNIGKLRFEESVKVIFAAGKLTDAAQKAAIENEMNIMRPETLQRLVELKSRYPGAINLLELEPYLRTSPFGEESEEKIHQYINSIEQNINVRIHIINLVKAHVERTREKDAEIGELVTAYLYSNPPKPLERRELLNILIELSSPLLGYLGRREGKNDNDRFYFLRDLIID